MFVRKHPLRNITKQKNGYRRLGNMKHVIRKKFWSWDFDKEEEWLNQMSAKGFQLTSVSFNKFEFEDGAPGKYLYRLELLDQFPGSAEGRRSISSLEDTGAEYVGSVLRWVIFRKEAALGRFNLFSDTESRLKHLKRLQILLLITGVSVFLTGIINLSVFLHGGFGSNLSFGVIDFILGLLLLSGFAQIFFKKRRLKRERTLQK